MAYQVLLFYSYVTIEDPAALRERLLSLCARYELTGRGIVANEGINATLEGTLEHTEAFLKDFLTDERFSSMLIKRSEGTGKSFPKLSIKVREEIVGTQFPKDVDPRVQTAPRITAEELRSWYEGGEDFTVIDMRNDYEYQSGHFKDSINPELENSRDLPKAIPKLAHLKDKKVLTVCTGGVRCEKMSALLLKEGFTDVYQLENGIHGYMEKYPGKDFKGTLYTFDQRLVMDFGGEREVVGTCRRCTENTERYVNCANLLCHLHFLVCEHCEESSGTYCSDTCAKTATPYQDTVNTVG